MTEGGKRDIIEGMSSPTSDKLIRFPPELFTQMKEAAWSVRSSQNQYVVDAVQEKIARDRARARAAERRKPE